MKKLLLSALTIYTIGINAQGKFLDFNNGNIGLAYAADDNLRSLECWFRLDTQIDPSLATIQTLMYRLNGGSVDAFGLYFGQSTSTGAEGRLVFVRRIGSTAYNVVSNNNTWAPGVWHHVAGVIDPITGMKLYIDGVLQTSTHTSNTATTSSTTNMNIGSFGNNTRYFDGQLDNIGLWTRALLPSEVQNHASMLCYPFDPSTQSGLNAFYNFDNDNPANATIVDLSPSGNSGTRTMSTTTLQTGACFVPVPIAVVGQNYSAGINNNSKLNIGGTVGNGVRSIECWFKLNQSIDASLPQAQTLIYRNSASGDEDYGLFFGASNFSGRQGKIVFNRSWGSSLNYIVSDANSWPANEWHHVVGVIDPTTGMALYIDGVKQTSTIPGSTYTVVTKTTPTYIGAWGSTTNRYFDGNLDGIRLWDRALTQAEINLNMCGFDPNATQTGLIAHYDFEGTVNTWLDDKSGNNNHATNSTTAATQDTGQSCYKTVLAVIPSALSLNGTSASGKLALNSADGVRTAECWFKLDDPIDNTLVTTQTLIIKSKSNGTRDFGLFFGQSTWTGREGKLTFVRRIGSVNNYIVSNSNTWAANVWHHVAGVIDPTNGMELYIDGVKQTDTHSSNGSAQHDAGSYNPTVGAWGQSGRNFKGEIDELRLWTRALTVTEINTNNCGNFDPSTQTGLKGYWNFDQESGVNPALNLSGTTNTMNFFSGATRVSDDPCGIVAPSTGLDVINVCNGTPYQWIDGSFYHTSISSGVFHTIIGAAINGGDSIVELNLTIDQAATSTDTQAACSSYTWINGTTYNASNNTAIHTIVGGAASGCDSIVTLNLTINANVTATQTVSACGSYTWINGTTYNSSNNTATHTVAGATVNGCDSVYTLNLTINNNETATQTIVACGSYTWLDGTTYTTNNTTATHTVSGATVNGCDSVYTLNLTINSNDTKTQTITACNSYTWINGTTYNANNTTATHTVSGATVNGCDSVYTLNLTINSNDTKTQTITACNNYTWIDGLTYTTSNNTATHIVSGATVNGCDSVYTLNLTITIVDITTNINGNIITVNATGSSYRWLDCGNSNAVIVGETGSTYTPTSSGNYAVEVTTNGCVDTSACVNMVITSVNDINNTNSSINIFPNPTTGTVTFKSKKQISKIVLLNTTGKMIAEYNNVTTIDISNLPLGVYFAKITTQNNSTIVQKLIKK